jgi:hypothetical protein
MQDGTQCGQPRQALNFYMIAAHMSGKVSKWKVSRF